jgi:type IV pilus assembly protein PilW
MNRRPAARGFGLIESLLAVLACVALCLAISTAVVRFSRAYQVLATEVRMEDAARLALDTLEADLRMAGHWGTVASSDLVADRAATGDPVPSPFGPTESANLQACGGPGSNWAIDLDNRIAGADGGYALACAAYTAGQPGADVLVLRRAEGAEATSFDSDRLYVATHPLHGRVFAPTPACTSVANAACWPAGFAPHSAEVRELVVRAYYVDRQSTQRSDVPSLRRKSFANVRAASVGSATFDEEIMPGVEDLQLQWGVDVDADGNVDAYVAPGAAPPGSRPLSVALWLRVRADEPDPRFVDGRQYRYGGMRDTYAPRDHYRRLLVTRTVRLRNPAH